MRRTGMWVVLGAALTVAISMTATAASGAVARSEAKKPIIIGAAMDLTANMAPYDTPALYAVQLAATKINAQGGIGGRRLQVNVCNHQLKNQKTCALQLIQQGAVIGMVTCDVEYAAPAVQEFINKRMLTLAPCIGTDQMGPKRFGPNGRLAFTFGNIAQDEAAAMAEYAYGRGWRRAVIVKDNLLAYFQNVADLFKARFTELGGTVVQEEGFSSFSNTIQNAISKVAPTNADVIAFPTAFDGLAPFVGGSARFGKRHADHQLLGWRRELLVAAESAGTQLLLRDLRIDLRRRPEVGGQSTREGSHCRSTRAKRPQPEASFPAPTSSMRSSLPSKAEGLDEGCGPRCAAREVQGIPGDLGEDHLLQDRPRRHGSCVPRDGREQQPGEVRPFLEDEEARKASVDEVGAGRNAWRGEVARRHSPGHFRVPLIRRSGRATRRDPRTTAWRDCRAHRPQRRR